MDNFLWIGLPYMAFLCLVVGTLLRFMFFERNWTSKSSEFLEKKYLRILGPLFHLSLLMVIGGHVAGILVPKEVTAAMGISEEMYHLAAITGGGLGGTILLVSFIGLQYRRLVNGRLKVNTSTTDKWLFLLLLLAIVTGYMGALSNVVSHFDYRVSIAPWFRGLLMLQPDPSLMKDVPMIYKLHMFSWMAVAIIFPFSRLVHCLSFPFEYLWRSAIVYRRR